MKKLLLTIILLASAQCYASVWESVPHNSINEPFTYRMSVPHGWLISKGSNESAVCFYPDEKHEWKI